MENNNKFEFVMQHRFVIPLGYGLQQDQTGAFKYRYKYPCIHIPSDMLGQLKGGESRDIRWVGEEVDGKGLCLQMLILWMLELQRNLSGSLGVNEVATEQQSNRVNSW